MDPKFSPNCSIFIIDCSKIKRIRAPVVTGLFSATFNDGLPTFTKVGFTKVLVGFSKFLDGFSKVLDGFLFPFFKHTFTKKS